jgi:uncharacterized membrane protein YdbT with pleckstrin-like domain
LSDGEVVVLRLRPHGSALVAPAVALVLVCGAAGFAAGALPAGRYEDAGRLAVTVGAVLVLARVTVLPYLRWWATSMLLTDRRLRLRHGVVRSRTRDVPLSRVAHVAVERGLADRLLRRGTLVVATAGDSVPVVVRRVPGVRRVADVLTDVVDEADRVPLR